MNRNEFFSLVSDRPTVELGRIQLAYWLAKNAHRPFKRDNGDRYFEHPRAVAVSLIKHGFGETDYIVTGLLHDVVEDTNTPWSVIVDLFGPEIWRSLETLSRYMPVFDPVTGQTINRHKKIIEEYYGELAKASAMVRTVKCADRLNNLETCGVWDDERRDRYITETRQFIFPIAKDLHINYADEIEKILNALKKS